MLEEKYFYEKEICVSREDLIKNEMRENIYNFQITKYLNIKLQSRNFNKIF